ncbi:MAG TPA: hypothetical protein VHA78_02750 [Candidatus Peribacteraceae bacterium]|nr:hypothetical protein [Candidatus Peribacteraceae bacterium]
MAKNPHEQAEKMYQQILDLLEEISLLYADAGDEGEEDELNDRDIVDMMIEEAIERGMDDESVEKVFKAISSLARKAREG